MTALRRVAAVLGCGLALAGCRNVHGIVETRGAMERAGYREVDISFRSGGGIDVVRVAAVPITGDAQPDQVAGVVWATLPLRFDRLVVSLRGAGTTGSSAGYADLAARFGPRPADLDRRQVGDEVVQSGLKLMLVLSAGALISVGAVVGLGLAAMRGFRRSRAGPETQPGPISELGEDSPTAGSSWLADDPEEIPS